MLTLEKLKSMKPHEVIATGTENDNPEGLNMSNSGKVIRWVAVRGGIHDWTIYCLFANHSIEEILRVGDKVNAESHIRKLVECDNEAFKMYRF